MEKNHLVKQCRWLDLHNTVRIFLNCSNLLEVINLGVKGGSRVQEEFADLVHPIRVAGGVL